MRIKRAVIGIVLPVAVWLAPVVFVSPAYGDSVSDESAFVAKINALRAAHGAGPLQVNNQLTSVARGWAQTMANKGTIWHNPSLGSAVTENWQKLGENVGMGGDVDGLFQAFVNSPGHYHNLVDPSFNYIGVGVVWNGNQMFTSHEFMQMGGARAAAPAAAPSKPKAQAQSAASAQSSSAAQPEPTPAAETPPPPPPPPPLPERTIASLEELRVLATS